MNTVHMAMTFQTQLIQLRYLSYFFTRTASGSLFYVIPYHYIFGNINVI